MFTSDYDYTDGYMADCVDFLATDYQQHYQLKEQLCDALEALADGGEDVHAMKERAAKIRECGSTLVSDWTATVSFHLYMQISADSVFVRCVNGDVR